MSEHNDAGRLGSTFAEAAAPYGKLLGFLNSLRKHSIAHSLVDSTGVVMVRAYVPGEMWEIEFLESGGVQVERLISASFVDQPFSETRRDVLDFFVTLYGDREVDSERFVDLYPTLYPKLVEILGDRDPLSLGAGSGAPRSDIRTRYAPAVEFMLTYLWADGTLDDATQTVYRAMAHTFGWERVGSPDRYRQVAADIWREWTRTKGVACTQN